MKHNKSEFTTPRKPYCGKLYARHSQNEALTEGKYAT